MIIIKRKKELFLEETRENGNTYLLYLFCKCRVANGRRGRKQGVSTTKREKKPLKTGGGNRTFENTEGKRYKRDI